MISNVLNKYREFSDSLLVNILYNYNTDNSKSYIELTLSCINVENNFSYEKVKLIMKETKASFFENMAIREFIDNKIKNITERTNYNINLFNSLGIWGNSSINIKNYDYFKIKSPRFF